MVGTATANGQYASDTKTRVLCFSAESEKQTLRGEMNLMTRIRMTISGTEKFHCAQVYSPRLVPFRGVLIFAI